jgi:hypothetical protein
MSFDEETTLNDDVLEELDEATDEEEINPLAEINTNTSSDENEEKEDEELDEDDIDDAKLFGGVDDEDEGYNPLDEHNSEDWS